MKKFKCNACGGIQSDTIKSSVARIKLFICKECSFVLTNRKSTCQPNVTTNSRLGAHGKAGRSFEMARLGALLSQSYGLSVAIHRQGADGDIDRIRNIPMVDTVSSIETLANLDPYSFDLIIMNETLQSLDTPASLHKILSSLKDGGLAICSTDINDNHNLSKSQFFNATGTKCMWSGSSLISAARKLNMVVDFRVPQIAVRKKFHRKRYVIFYKSEKIEQALRLYFSKSAHAPSE